MMDNKEFKIDFDANECENNNDDYDYTQKVIRKNILNMSHENPIINYYLQMWRVGEFDFEQALMYMVYRFAFEDNKMRKEISERFR